jgi:hypothetical protein
MLIGFAFMFVLMRMTRKARSILRIESDSGLARHQRINVRELETCDLRGLRFENAVNANLE